MDTSQLLRTAWDFSPQGIIVFEVANRDLKVLIINNQAKLITQGLLSIGDLLCEKMPHHYDVAYPYGIPLIDIYLGVKETRELEFNYDDGLVKGWFKNIVVRIDNDLLCITFVDITKEKELSIKDPLTGIYNRRVIGLEQYYWNSCFYLDLDKFKQINDSRGHNFGDQVLIEVGKILNYIADENRGIAIREGGDEFILFLNEMEDKLYSIACECLWLINGITLEDQRQLVSASIGVSSGKVEYFDNVDSRIEQLILAAETASREAKNNRKSDLPKDRIVVWDKNLGASQRQKHSIELHLRDNQLDEQIWIAYQPIIDMTTNEIVGVEALMRWRSPALGIVDPDIFIPVAEATGTIYKLSRLVLEDAINQLSQWQKIKLSFSVSVNISPAELEDDEFAPTLAKMLGSANINRGFGIEVTERGIYANPDKYLSSLEKLSEASITLKVDDFGTGNSGLWELVEFPFKEVKIDKRFVPKNDIDSNKIAVCRAISDLSKSLGFSSIIEGVELELQKDILLDLGFKLGQGYYFYHPVSKEKITELLIDSQSKV